jgi:hypothetical protein
MNLTLRKTSKDLFAERKSILQKENPALYAALFETQRAQLTDQAYYSAKAVGAVSTTDAIFKSDDAKVDGLRNVANAKLDAGKAILVDRLMILSGINATLASTVFEPVAKDVLQGEIEIIVDKKIFLPRQPLAGLLPTVRRQGAHATETQVTEVATQETIIFLDNPKFIFPEKEIQVRMWWPANLTANTNIKFGFLGSGVDNY